MRPRRALPGAARGASVDPLDEDLHLAAASEPDLPGLLVGDAEIEEARLAVGDGIERLAHHRALNATARHRADEVAGIVDGKLRADRAGRGAPGRYHRRQREALAGALPGIGLLQDFGAVFHL